MVPPALRPDLSAWGSPLRDEIISHHFKVSFYSYGWISVCRPWTARRSFTLLRSACVQIVQKFFGDRRAQKQLIWEEAQNNSRCLKKPFLKTQHSQHSNLFLILYKKNNKILKINMLLLLYIDTKKQVNCEGETMRPNNGALKCRRLLCRILKRKGQWCCCSCAHRAASMLLACHLYLHLAELKYLNTTYWRLPTGGGTRTGKGTWRHTRAHKHTDADTQTHTLI